MSNPSITADKSPWYQWDTGLTVTVSGGEMTECHFANRKQGTAYVQAVIKGKAKVPDELLQVAAPITAYGYIPDGAGGQTYIEQVFDVIARNIPADYTYTKTAQKTIRDAEKARDEAVQAAKDAKASALAADDSAVEASKSAQSAGDSVSAAATSARAAAKSAGDAAASVNAINVIAPKKVKNAPSTKSLLSVAIGDNAIADDINSVVIGRNAHAMAGGGVCIGNGTAVAVGTSVAIGEASSSTKNNEVSIGNDSLNREITHVSTPTAPTSASTKKYTDDNDAKTLTEAKKYTDDNTTNALIGTVSGKLLHVEDAWPSPLLSMTVDGAYKQDGTPSPDNPVPIVVVENPVLKVMGRNLLDLSTLSPNTAINSDTGAYYESSSGNWYANREKLSFAFAAGLTLTMSVTDSSETTSVFFTMRTVHISHECISRPKYIRLPYLKTLYI